MHPMPPTSHHTTHRSSQPQQGPSTPRLRGKRKADEKQATKRIRETGLNSRPRNPRTKNLERTYTTADCETNDGDGQTTTSSVQLPDGFSLPAGTPTQVVTAIEYELKQLGKPYIYAGTGPTGYDCSGLVMEAYLAAGISLPRTTYQQVDVGTPIYSASQLKPGDLIFTAGSDGTDSNPGHVGMYLGDDLVEDAPHTGANIELSKFDGGYWNESAVAFRRIVN